MNERNPKALNQSELSLELITAVQMLKFTFCVDSNSPKMDWAEWKL